VPLSWVPFSGGIFSSCSISSKGLQLSPFRMAKLVSYGMIFGEMVSPLSFSQSISHLPRITWFQFQWQPQHQNFTLSSIYLCPLKLIIKFCNYNQWCTTGPSVIWPAWHLVLYLGGHPSSQPRELIDISLIIGLYIVLLSGYGDQPARTRENSSSGSFWRTDSAHVLFSEEDVCICQNKPVFFAI
jgi:hypothetical protein